MDATGSPDPSATWQGTKDAIQADLRRRGVAPTSSNLARFIAKSGSMRYQVVLRLLQFVQRHHRRTLAHAVLHLMHRRMTIKYGWEIPAGTRVGPGLLLRHLGPVVIHQDAVLGRNVNLTTGVIVGRSFRGEREGVPVVGDNVYIGPGAKVIGAITIGDDVAIGANAVVTRDVETGSVVAGIPARVISQDGAERYVEHRT